MPCVRAVRRLVCTAVYASVVAWSFRPGVIEAVRECFAGTVLPVVMDQGGCGAYHIVRSGQDNFVTLMLHAGVDWDWEMPIVTVSEIAIGAALIRIGRKTDRKKIGNP